jgi:hypothetical protein
VTDVGVLVLRPLCEPQWAKDLFCLPGLNGQVLAITEWDDGNGGALYVGGNFRIAGCANAVNLAKWDGATWSALASGTNNSVSCLAVFDDGTGPALFAGGSFNTAGGLFANKIAKWDGTSWSPVGQGMNDLVASLTVFDDGSGAALYAGGEFSIAGGISASRVAKWNGATWSALNTGLGGNVFALTVHNDGTGSALYAGGEFTIAAGGTSVNRIAKWDGASWSSLGDGIGGGFPAPRVSSLVSFDDGNAPALYAAGQFTTAGGKPANRIAKWDGSSWSALGSGMNNSVSAMAVFDDGNGPALYAGGYFSSAGGVNAGRIAKWDGLSWLPVGMGVDHGSSPAVQSLAVISNGTASILYAGGSFSVAGGAALSNIASWDGMGWSPLGSGIGRPLFPPGISCLANFDDGNGAAIYAGGTFTVSDSPGTNSIAKWNGTTWSSLDAGVGEVVVGGDPLGTVVRAATSFSDGSGPALFAAGIFQTAGSLSARNIAKWDGTSWQPLGDQDDGLNNAGHALTVFNDGTGAALYVGGLFNVVGGIGVNGLAANKVAKWDGSSWFRLGDGLNNFASALAVFDDGNGPALYAGGSFTSAGGMGANRIAKWDGRSWLSVGLGTNNTVSSLTTFDDGTKPALYAGGAFTSAGGSAANRIAKWDGFSWSSLGSGMNNQVSTLVVFDDGTGPALYAGGDFTIAGGVTVNRIAKWDGASWTSLDVGLNGWVGALIPFDDGTGPALYVGGTFTSTTGGTVSAYMAKWHRPAECP